MPYPYVIHKQELVVTDLQTLKLPVSAKILSIQAQGNKLIVWYEWYQHPGNDQMLEDWKFAIIGTGHDFNPANLVYLSTVQMPPFVWHVYRVTS